MQSLISRLREYASTRKGELADLITEAADALERQTCEDAVSRAAAIDAVLRAEALVRAYGYRYAADAVRELPSVQPQPEEDCDTCKHGFFGSRQCDNCRVRYLSHYEREEERRTDEQTD